MKVPYTPESFRESRMVRAYPEWFGKIPNGSGNPRMIRDPELFEETTLRNVKEYPLTKEEWYYFMMSFAFERFIEGNIW